MRQWLKVLLPLLHFCNNFQKHAAMTLNFFTFSIYVTSVPKSEKKSWGIQGD